MSLIQLDDSIGDVLAKMSAGNPGAITVLIQMFSKSPEVDPQCAFAGLGPILSLDTYKIYGPDIWVLYKDICKEDVVRTLAMIRGVQLGLLPLEKLKAAIFAAREGLREEQVSAPIDPEQVLRDVMEQLEQFNRKEAA